MNKAKGDLDFPSTLSPPPDKPISTPSRSFSTGMRSIPEATYPHSYVITGALLFSGLWGLLRTLFLSHHNLFTILAIRAVINLLVLAWAVWRLLNPYVSRYSDSITVRHSLWRQETFPLNEISRVIMTKKYLYVNLITGESIRILLRPLSKYQQEELYHSLRKLARNKQK